MEIYKARSDVKPIYYFVIKREKDAVYTLKASGGSLGKWGFHKFPEEKFDKFHYNPYKGDIEHDVKERVLEAIFTVPTKTLTTGPEIWG